MTDRPLVEACPGCGGMMWSGSSACARCRALRGDSSATAPPPKDQPAPVPATVARPGKADRRKK